ncbi:MAG: Mov34/MPN/PAD-1 family protein [Promethearchaeota archaeon]
MNKKVFEKQVNRISGNYDIKVIDPENGVIGVQLHKKVFIILDLGKYPEKPKVKIPKDLQKIVGKPKKFLETLSEWNKKESPEVIDILNEFSNFIAIHGSGNVKISEELMLGILEWASNHRREILALLRTKKGIISEFILPPGMESNDSSAIFVPRRLAIDHSIIGTVHSHPSGNLTPSPGDKAFFSRYHLHIIVGPPFTLRDIQCYNREGKPILFELV